MAHLRFVIVLFTLLVLAHCGAQSSPLAQVTAALDADAGDAAADAADAAADAAVDAGVDAGPPPPAPFAYMILRGGQSDSGEQATFAGSSLAPWVAVPLVQYWHINSSRGISPTTFGPLGGKFGTELSDGKTLAGDGLPIKMSTVFISSTRCTAALPGYPGYNSALHLAIAAMVAALPSGPFAVPFNFIFDNGQTDSEASSETQAAYYSCLTAIDADLGAAVSGRRFHWTLHRTSIGPSSPPLSVPSLGHVNAAQDQFCTTRPDCTEVDTAPYAKQADGLHYTAASDVSIGNLDAASVVGVP